MRAIFSVVQRIGELFNARLGHKVIVEKSTVPLGTAQQMHEQLQEIIGEENTLDNHYTIVNMPEFLAEGTAINDLVNPQRVVIGTRNDHAFRLLSKLC